MNCELIASITALAISIANCLNDKDLSLLAAILSQLSSTLATISVQRENRAESTESPTSSLLR